MEAKGETGLEFKSPLISLRKSVKVAWDPHKVYGPDRSRNTLLQAMALPDAMAFLFPAKIVSTS